MSAVATATGPQRSPEQPRVPVFRTREALTGYLIPKEELERMGLEKALAEVDEKMKSQEGRGDILRRIREADPSLNGNVDAAFDQIHLNHEQLEKKEGFLKRMLKLPLRGVQAVGRTIKKHPVLTAMVLLTLAGGLTLYYTGWGAVLLAKLKDLAGPYLEKAGEWAQKAAEKWAGAKDRLPGFPGADGGMPDVPRPTDIPGADDALRRLQDRM